LAYLRDRPFLLLQFARGPAIQKGASKTRTERKDWMDNQANVTITEHPLVVDRVKDKHMIGCGVIIDIVYDSIIKNNLSDSPADVLAHFKSKYADLIERGRSGWMRQTSSRIEASRRFEVNREKSVAVNAISGPEIRRSGISRGR
jgi:hypothetical protein